MKKVELNFGSSGKKNAMTATFEEDYMKNPLASYLESANGQVVLQEEGCIRPSGGEDEDGVSLTVKVQQQIQKLNEELNYHNGAGTANYYRDVEQKYREMSTEVGGDLMSKEEQFRTLKFKKKKNTQKLGKLEHQPRVLGGGLHKLDWTRPVSVNKDITSIAGDDNEEKLFNFKLPKQKQDSRTHHEFKSAHQARTLNSEMGPKNTSTFDSGESTALQKTDGFTSKFGTTQANMRLNTMTTIVSKPNHHALQPGSIWSPSEKKLHQFSTLDQAKKYRQKTLLHTQNNSEMKSNGGDTKDQMNNTVTQGFLQAQNSFKTLPQQIGPHHLKSLTNAHTPNTAVPNWFEEQKIKKVMQELEELELKFHSDTEEAALHKSKKQAQFMLDKGLKVLGSHCSSDLVKMFERCINNMVVFIDIQNSQGINQEALQQIEREKFQSTIEERDRIIATYKERDDEEAYKQKIAWKTQQHQRDKHAKFEERITDLFKNDALAVKKIEVPYIVTQPDEEKDKEEEARSMNTRRMVWLEKDLDLMSRLIQLDVGETLRLWHEGRTENMVENSNVQDLKDGVATGIQSQLTNFHLKIEEVLKENQRLLKAKIPEKIDRCYQTEVWSMERYLDELDSLKRQKYLVDKENKQHEEKQEAFKEQIKKQKEDLYRLRRQVTKMTDKEHKIDSMINERETIISQLKQEIIAEKKESTQKDVMRMKEIKHLKDEMNQMTQIKKAQELELIERDKELRAKMDAMKAKEMEAKESLIILQREYNKKLAECDYYKEQYELQLQALAKIEVEVKAELTDEGASKKSKKSSKKKIQRDDSLPPMGGTGSNYTQASGNMARAKMPVIEAHENRSMASKSSKRTNKAIEEDPERPSSGKDNQDPETVAENGEFKQSVHSQHREEEQEEGQLDEIDQEVEVEQEEQERKSNDKAPSQASKHLSKIKSQASIPKEASEKQQSRHASAHLKKEVVVAEDPKAQSDKNGGGSMHQRQSSVKDDGNHKNSRYDYRKSRDGSDHHHQHQEAADHKEEEEVESVKSLQKPAGAFKHSIIEEQVSHMEETPLRKETPKKEEGSPPPVEQKQGQTKQDLKKQELPQKPQKLPLEDQEIEDQEATFDQESSMDKGSVRPDGVYPDDNERTTAIFGVQLQKDIKSVGSSHLPAHPKTANKQERSPINYLSAKQSDASPMNKFVSEQSKAQLPKGKHAGVQRKDVNKSNPNLLITTEEKSIQVEDLLGEMLKRSHELGKSILQVQPRVIMQTTQATQTIAKEFPDLKRTTVDVKFGPSEGGTTAAKSRQGGNRAMGTGAGLNHQKAQMQQQISKAQKELEELIQSNLKQMAELTQQNSPHKNLSPHTQQETPQISPREKARIIATQLETFYENLKALQTLEVLPDETSQVDKKSSQYGRKGTMNINYGVSKGQYQAGSNKRPTQSQQQQKSQSPAKNLPIINNQSSYVKANNPLQQQKKMRPSSIDEVAFEDDEDEEGLDAANQVQKNNNLENEDIMDHLHGGQHFNQKHDMRIEDYNNFSQRDGRSDNMGNRSRSKRSLGVVERLSNSPPQREGGPSHLKMKNEMIAKKIHKGIEMSVNQLAQISKHTNKGIGTGGAGLAVLENILQKRTGGAISNNNDLLLEEQSLRYKKQKPKKGKTYATAMKTRESVEEVRKSQDSDYQPQQEFLSKQQAIMGEGFFGGEDSQVRSSQDYDLMEYYANQRAERPFNALVIGTQATITQVKLTTTTTNESMHHHHHNNQNQSRQKSNSPELGTAQWLKDESQKQ